jgi:hypothetical protein
MDRIRWQRWGAASGFAVLALGAAAAAIDAGTVSVRDPVETITAYFSDNRTALLAQSLLFVIGAGIFVWFLGSLRSFLARAEGPTGRLSEVAFGAGVAYVAISLGAQAGQIGLAMASEVAPVQPALLGTTWALFTIASVPLAVMLAATAAVAFRTKVFPAWLAWLSLAVAAAYLMLLCGIVVESGPLSPTGWVTYAPYPLYGLWLVSATVVMVRRLGTSTPITVTSERPRAVVDHAG